MAACKCTADYFFLTARFRLVDMAQSSSSGGGAASFFWSIAWLLSLRLRGGGCRCSSGTVPTECALFSRLVAHGFPSLTALSSPSASLLRVGYRLPMTGVSWRRACQVASVRYEMTGTHVFGEAP